MITAKDGAARGHKKAAPKEGRGRKMPGDGSRNMHPTPMPEQTNCAELVPPFASRNPHTEKHNRSPVSILCKKKPSSFCRGLFSPLKIRRTEQAEPLPENKSQALPAHRPNLGGIMSGGKPGKLSGRYPKGMKTLPNPWHTKPKSKPRRKKGGLGRLMG